MFGSQAVARNEPGVRCEYQLTMSDVGIADVKIDDYVLEVEISDARADTLYTVWIDFRNRDSGSLADDYKPLLDRGALKRGVAPAFASTAGVTAGMGLDPNGIITDKSGDGKLEAILDYELLNRGDAPVVGAELAMQGLNRVGGYWLRVYEGDPSVASLQRTDLETGLPVVERATPQGITIQRHLDFVTHGHTPGVAGVDHLSAFKGDFPADCLPLP